MERHFEGVIGRDWRTSEPWWPPEPEPPAGAPNVLLLVLDDVGAARSRLRPLVRVPRWRDPPVRAVALPRQPFGAPAGPTRGRVPPQRGPRRSRDRVPRRPARGRRRPPVLLLPRDRRVPLAAS